MKFHRIKNIHLFGVILLTLTIFLSFAGCSQSESNEKIVINYQNKFNSHNVDSLMEVYSDEIIFNIPNMRMKLTGKKALRGIAEFDSVLHTVMEISNIKVGQDTVFCSLRETNDWMEIVGISASYYPNTKFVVSEDKIKYFETNLADSSLENLGAVMRSFIPWAKKTYPDELNILMPEGSFQFYRANGVSYLDLLQKWKASEE